MGLDLSEFTMEERIEMARLAGARDEVCRQCIHYIYKNGHWQWARCFAMGVNAEGLPTTELSGEVRKIGSCPLGKWDGVVGITDVEAVAKELVNAQNSAMKNVTRLGPMFQKLGLVQSEVAINEMVAAGNMGSLEAVETLKLLKA